MRLTLTLLAVLAIAACGRSPTAVAVDTTCAIKPDTAAPYQTNTESGPSLPVQQRACNQ